MNADLAKVIVGGYTCGDTTTLQCRHTSQTVGGSTCAFISSRPVVLQAENSITKEEGWSALIAVLDHCREEAGGVVAGAWCDEGWLRHKSIAPIGAKRALATALHKVDGVCSVTAVKVSCHALAG